MSKVVSVAEIVKRRMRGLHQHTSIGLAAARAEGARSTPTIAITLSRDPLDVSLPGCAAHTAATARCRSAL